jgi:hypothetical protein
MPPSQNGPDTLLRWIIDGGDPTSRFREKERIVNDIVSPALAQEIVASGVRDYHVSKRRGCEVWLTVIAPSERVEAVERAITPFFRACTVRRSPPQPNEPLLDPAHLTYRRRLRQVTDVALDLHRDANLVEHQMFLIQLACGTEDQSRLLDDYLVQTSPTYAAIPEVERPDFWRAFAAPPPAPGLETLERSFWNLVVGCNPQKGGNPVAVADLIGIAL